MSRMRPELGDAGPGSRSPDAFDTFWMVRDSVERQPGLIWGKLEDKSGVCAIGAYFKDHPRACLSRNLIDEIAYYNDSIPRHVSPRDRRNRVLRWLSARIDYMRRPIAALKPKRSHKKTAA